MKRSIIINKEDQYFKASCLLASLMSMGELVLRPREKLLQQLLLLSTDGVLVDAHRYSGELMELCGLDSYQYHNSIKFLKKDGLLGKRGSSFVFHPMLVYGQEGDQELSIKLNQKEV